MNPCYQVAVCGGGVIGSATAYYLSLRNVPVVILDRTAGDPVSASAKAGGFLARDWCDGSEVGPLARKSFEMHAQLAEALGAEEIGYRPVTTLRAAAREPGFARKASKKGSGRGRGASGRGGGGGSSWEGLPGWLDGSVLRSVGTLGSEQDTAQVHPLKLTRALRQACEELGGKLQAGQVVGLELAAVAGSDGSGDGGAAEVVARVAGVRLVDGTLVEADAVVLAMGAWTHLAAEWIRVALPPGQEHPLPQLAGVQGSKAHSVVLQSPTPAAVTPHALFLDYTAASGARLEPEVYPRPAGEVYVCGVMEDPGCPPADPADVQPSPGAPETLLRVAEVVAPQALRGASSLSPSTPATATATAGASDTALDGGDGAQCGGSSSSVLTSAQACLLPLSPDGVPLIGQVPGVKGLYVATGHSCWGILNAPATGAAIAELVATGGCTLLDLGPFDPARLAPAADGSGRAQRRGGQSATAAAL